MTERVGRHAADGEDADTLILPAQPWLPADDVDPAPPVPRAGGPFVGRHASSPDHHRPDRWIDDPMPVVPQQTGRPAGSRVPAVILGSPVVRARRTPGTDAERGTALNGHGQSGVTGREPANAAGQGTGSPAGGPARQPSRGTAGSASSLRLVWVYPDLLSTYGDRGNLLVLSRRARLRGITAEAIEVNADQPVPRQGDIYLLGGGEDLPQILAARRLRADGGLHAAARQGAAVFAVCAGYQIIGERFGGVEGEPVDGLGLLDITSGRGEQRGVGELVADVDPSLGVPRLTGFENHQGVTTVRSGARPLGRVSHGVGNGDGTEGAFAGRVLGTYLHGPALARNPGLADLLLSWAAGPLAAIDPAEEVWASRLRAERFAAVPQ